MKPVIFVTEPTVYGAESCVLIRDLLESVEHNVSEVKIDLAIQYGAHPRSKPFDLRFSIRSDSV